MEACLEQMRLANANLQTVFEMAQERLFAEDKALAREKALARMRAKLPTPQKTIEQVAREVTKKAKGIRAIVLDDPRKVEDIHHAIAEALDERED